ncbi:MAG: hypothetical protein AB4372_11365 [Xenococcus sp. (in: cyanobacteria)]
MKNMIFLATIALTFSVQGIAISQDSGYKMGEEEFTNFVCAYLEAMDREAAIDAVKSEAMSLFTEQQIVILDEVKMSNRAAAKLCH